MAFPELLASFTTGQSAVFRTLVTIGLLIAGHLAVKIVTIVIRKIWMKRGEDLTKKAMERRYDAVKHLKYVLDAGVIAVALLYLNTGLTATLTQQLTANLPKVLSVLLIGLLGFIGVNLLTKFGGGFISRVGTRNYFREVGLSDNAIELISMAVKGFLYLIVIQVVLEQLGIGNTFINKAINASSYAVVFLAAALFFWGFKDLFSNIAAGIYLKSSRLVRPGEKVYLEEESGEIRGVDLFSTQIETDSGYTMMTQNSKVMNGDLKFKRTQSDIETLEDMKKYFTAQDPSYCGPASAEMALSIFGYRYTQEEIGELSGAEEGRGIPPGEVGNLTGAIEDLTDGEVEAAYVEYEKITDLSDEFKVWFNDGALIIPHFAKPMLFPQTDTGHYSLCVGVEGDELLIVDPSTHTVSGGVYYADSSEMLEAMGEWEGSSRGYIVLAPEDTTAYWRISKDLIYVDETFYDSINKNMELQLRRILRQGRILKNVLPDQLENFLEQWKKEEKVGRVWKPENSGRGGDDDESTDSGN
ncbi:MAG: C39 family peptidase [Candidatus Nanosalina sp.]